MRKLYVRIYFAVLASLAVFALAAGLLWRAFGEGGPWSPAYEVAATLAQNALPPASAPKAEQQAALDKLAANLRAHLALFASDRSPLAAVGAPVRKAGLEQDIADLDAMIDETLLARRLDAVKELDPDEEVDLLALAAEECARYDDAQLDGEPVTLCGDPRLLRRMIRNLLENAKRHGAPPIAVRVSRAGDGAELALCDHGQGVPEAQRERVFDPFYRRMGIKEISGAGLGLALVRQIARRHGGEVRYAPRSGQGGCFIVVLPERVVVNK